jgi:hypothetical protein
MKYSFAYEVSIADKLDGKKQGAIEQNSEGFSTISDVFDHRGTSQNYRFPSQIIRSEGG